MAKYLLTGCAGFVGSHLLDRLLKDGHQVIGVDNFSSGLLENMPTNNKNFQFFEEDVEELQYYDKEYCDKYFQNIDCVFHCAANARIQQCIQYPWYGLQNIQMTFSVLEFMRKCNIKKIVYSSSSSIYGRNNIPFKEHMRPDCLNPYSLSKYVGEEYIDMYHKLYGINGISLRYYNVFGPREPVHIGELSTVVGKFFKQALVDKKPLTIIGTGEQRRSFTYVDDIVEANIKAMEQVSYSGFGYEAVNIGTNINYSINEIADMVLDSLCLPRDFRVHVSSRPAESQETLADISLAKTLLKWQPTVDIKDKINEHRDYYRKKWNL